MRVSFSRAILLSVALSSCTSMFSDYGETEAIKVKQHSLIENMRRLQISVENYAADHNGDVYPVNVSQIKPFLPGGDEANTPAPTGLFNPFSLVNEFPIEGKVESLRTARFGERMKIARGRIVYCPLESGKGYAILGGDHDGNAIMDEKNPGQVLVFSNFED